MEYLDKVLGVKVTYEDVEFICSLWHCICRNGAAPKKVTGRNTSIGADASTAFHLWKLAAPQRVYADIQEFVQRMKNEIAEINPLIDEILEPELIQQGICDITILDEFVSQLTVA